LRRLKTSEQTSKRTGQSRAIGHAPSGVSYPNRTCSAITSAGERCKKLALAGSDKCWSHDPGHAEALREAGRKGGKKAGRGRPAPVIPDLERLQRRFESLADMVLNGEADSDLAGVACKLLNGARACVAARIKAQEVQDHDVRLGEIEAVMRERGMVRRGR
jgi:hypothetical protein